MVAGKGHSPKGRPLTDAERQQRSEAGKRGYAEYVRRLLAKRSDDPDGVAAQLTMFRRHRGFRNSMGLTRDYVLQTAARLGVEMTAQPIRSEA